MIQGLKNLYFLCSFLLIFLVGCNSTEQNLSAVIGDGPVKNSTTTINGPLGNSALSFSPALKDFGTLNTNSGTSSQVFTVTNSSEYTVYLGTYSGNNIHYTVTANSCTSGLQLNPNQTCSVTIQFAPLTSGTLSTGFILPFGMTIGSATFNSTLSLTGAGTTLGAFTGISSLSNVGVTSLKINWTDAAGADSYQVYRIIAGIPTMISNITQASACVAGACSYSVSGLSPSTAYTYRVRATDALSVQEQNTNNQSATTLAGTLDLTGVATTTAGSCHSLTITTLDQALAPVNMTANTTVIIGGLGSGVLYSDVGCTTTLTNPIVASGASAKTFYLKDTVAETLSLTATLTTYTSGSLTLTVNPAAADHLVAVAGNTQTATIFNNVATQPQVKVVDQYGNGVSGQSISFHSLYNTKSSQSAKVVTSNSLGNVSINHKVGFTDIKDTLVIQRVGTALPDLAATGDPRLFYTFTSTTSGNGDFNSVFQTDTGPIGSASGDFNADGKIDLVFFTYGAAKIDIFLGNGKGHFYLSASYSASGTIYNGLVADLNGDGKLDVATADYSTSKMGVFIGNGNGTFVAEVVYTTGTNPFGIVSSDFDGDLDIDLAVTSRNSNTMNMFLNNGDGTFAAKVDYTTGGEPFWSSAYDIDLDGDKDLVIPNYTAQTISILYNNGNGTFAAKVDFSVGIAPQQAKVGLLNGDIYPDIVVTNVTSNTVSVLLGNITNNYSTRVDYVTGTTPRSIVIEDYNGDSKKDLIVVNGGSETVSLFLGNGDGTFNAKTDIAIGTGSTPYHIQNAVDLNADGYKDIVISEYGKNNFNILYGNGSSYQNPGRLYPTNVGPYSVDCADFNEDGKLDVITGHNTSANFAFFAGQTNGTLGTATTIAATSGLTGVTHGDFNNDNHLDVAFANYNNSTISVHFGNGNGTFVAGTTYAAALGVLRITTGDFNRDGYLDLATAEYDAGKAGVYLNNQDGTFAARVTYTVGSNPYDIQVLDYDKDKILDLAVSNLTSGTVSILKGNSNGTFNAKVDYTVGAGALGLVVGDFNNDTYQDFATGNYTANTISLVLNNQNGTFANATNYTAGTKPYFITAGDVNGDGYLDVIAPNYVANGTYEIFTGTGLGTLNPRKTYSNGTNSLSITTRTCDLNADGKLDIITAGYSNDYLQIVYGF